MPTIEENINIRVGVSGLDQARRAKSDLEDLQKASTGEVAGAESPEVVDVRKATAFQRQTNYLRMMSMISNKMMQDMRQGDFVGTKSYVKNLEKSIRHMRKMSDIVEDMGDEQDNQNRRNDVVRRRQGGGGMMLVGMARGAGGVAGQLGAQQFIGAGISGMGTFGAGMQQAGGRMGGRAGAALGGAGIGALIAAAVLAGGVGIDKLITGGFARGAPALLGLERGLGTPFRQTETTAITRNLRDLMIPFEQAIQSAQVSRRIAGGIMSPNRFNQMTRLMSMTGIDPDVAGELMGREVRFGGRMAPGRFVGMAEAGGYGRRVDVFAESVNKLIGSLQDMGVEVGSEAGAKIISELGRYGEPLRGVAGLQTAMGMTQAIRGAQALQTPQQAMLFRSLYTGDFSQTMDIMERGITGGNLQRVLSYVRGVTVDTEAQTRILRQMGVPSRSIAKKLLAGEMTPEQVAEDIKRQRRAVGVEGRITRDMSVAAMTVNADQVSILSTEAGVTARAKAKAKDLAERGLGAESETNRLERVQGVIEREFGGSKQAYQLYQQYIKERGEFIETGAMGMGLGVTPTRIRRRPSMFMRELESEKGVMINNNVYISDVNKSTIRMVKERREEE